MNTIEALDVLVVDDEADLCEMLAFEFSAKGHRVFSALNGQEAMRILEQEPISLLVTDVRMPDCDGLELLDWVKTRDVWKPAVVLISAYADIALEEAYALGAEALFTKPFRLAALTRVTKHILVSPALRWSVPPEIPPLRSITLHFPSLSGAQQSRAFDIGRGGIAFAGPHSALTPGESIGFAIQFDEGPFPALNGTGVVYWTRPSANPRNPYVHGVEFTSVTDDCRAALIEWQIAQSPRSYIPPLWNR